MLDWTIQLWIYWPYKLGNCHSFLLSLEDCKPFGCSTFLWWLLFSCSQYEPWCLDDFLFFLYYFFRSSELWDSSPKLHLISCAFVYALNSKSGLMVVKCYPRGEKRIEFVIGSENVTPQRQRFVVTTKRRLGDPNWIHEN